MTVWQVAYAEPVFLYLKRMRLYGTKLRAALAALGETADGVPVDGATQFEQNVFLWEVARYLVTYVRVEDETASGSRGRIVYTAIKGDRR